MKLFKKTWFALCLGIIMASTGISGIAFAATNTDQVPKETTEEKNQESESETESETEDLLEIFDTDVLSTTDVKIYSRAGLVMDADTGDVLYYKNPDTVHYPASITKLMTAYVAMQESDLDEVVTVTQGALDQIDWESSQLGVLAGQKLTMEECLYSLMLVSANDIAIAMGEHISGSTEDFATLMNYYAQSMGLSHTHFMNPHGLHDPDHYTTVYDASLIARACLNMPEFTPICSANSFQIQSKIKRTAEEIDKLKKENNGEVPNYVIYNHHKMVNNSYPYEKAFGGKTGYTKEARNCLTTFADNGKHRLICTVFDCPGGGKNYLYKDTEELFDFCFKNYKKLRGASQRKAGLIRHPIPYHINLFDPYIATHTLVDITKIAGMDADAVLAQHDIQNYNLHNYLIYDKLRSVSLNREEEPIELTFTEKAVHLVDITENENKSNDEIIVGILIIALIAIVVLIILVWLIKASRRKYKRLHYKSMKRKRKKAEREENLKS